MGATLRPGYRNRDSGTLYNAGQNGFSWSSSVNGSNARYLDFNNGGITPQNSNNRANGFQVRCLQHLSGRPVRFWERVLGE